MSTTLISREVNALLGLLPPSSATRFRWYCGVVSLSSGPVVLSTAVVSPMVKLQEDGE